MGICDGRFIVRPISIGIHASHPINRVLNFIIKNSVPKPGRKNFVAHKARQVRDPSAFEIECGRIWPDRFKGAVSIAQPPRVINASFHLEVKGIIPKCIIPTDRWNVGEQDDVGILLSDARKKGWVIHLCLGGENEKIVECEAITGLIKGRSGEKIIVGSPDVLVTVGRRMRDTGNHPVPLLGKEGACGAKQKQREDGASCPLQITIKHGKHRQWVRVPKLSDWGSTACFSSSIVQRIDRFLDGRACGGWWCLFETSGVRIQS